MSFVYKYFDKDDYIIYIGSTNDIDNRHKWHRTNSKWYPLAKRVRIDEYKNLKDAREAETEAIARFHPLFNEKLKGKKPHGWNGADDYPNTELPPSWNMTRRQAKKRRGEDFKKF